MNIAYIGTKSHLIKIVGRDEIGKVMSFVQTMDTVALVISNTLFTYIFKYTIDSYPGTVYQTAALLTLIPINVLMWIDLFTKRPLGDSDADDNIKNMDHKQMEHYRDRNDNGDISDYQHEDYDNNNKIVIKL